MTLTEKQIDELKEKHPGAELHVLENEDFPDVVVVVKTPNEGEWSRFRANVANEQTKPKALRTLLLACVVQPTAAELSVALARWPGLAETFGGELVELAGVSNATTRRKL